MSATQRRYLSVGDQLVMTLKKNFKYKTFLEIVEDPESQIQLVFTPGTCCTDSSGLHPSNTSILEPKTCSIRTCRHSSWLRTVLHQRYQN